MQNWDDLKLMLALSRYGTMSAAAQSLGLSTATVSRRLERCAENIGKTLFVRRGTVWEPTHASRELLELAEAVTDVFPSDQRQAPDDLGRRTLRLAVPLDICMDKLAPKLPTFLEENPRLMINTFHEMKSIAFGEADIRLGYEKPVEGRLIRLRAGSVAYRTYASAKHDDPPKGWAQIVDYERTSPPMARELEVIFGPPRLTTTSISCAVNLLEEMPLVVLLPTNFAARCEGLVPWQPDEPDRHYPVWAAYHESRKLDADVQLALAFVKESFAT